MSGSGAEDQTLAKKDKVFSSSILPQAWREHNYVQCVPRKSGICDLHLYTTISQVRGHSHVERHNKFRDVQEDSQAVVHLSVGKFGDYQRDWSGWQEGIDTMQNRRTVTNTTVGWVLQTFASPWFISNLKIFLIQTSASTTTKPWETAPDFAHQ